MACASPVRASGACRVIRPAEYRPVGDLPRKDPCQIERRDRAHRIARRYNWNDGIQRQHTAAVRVCHVAHPGLAGADTLVRPDLARGHDNIGLIGQQVGKTFVGVGHAKPEFGRQPAGVLIAERIRETYTIFGFS